MARDHVELLETSRWLVGLIVVSVLAGFVLLGLSALLSGGVRILLLILGIFIALNGVGGGLVFLWGAFVGFPFHFIPEQEPTPPAVPLGRRRQTM